MPRQFADRFHAIRSLVWIAVFTAAVVGGFAGAEPPPRVIFDTDMDSDNDDVAATAMLHALADEGLVQILAMGVVSTCQESPACLDAINTYYGRGDIPIGVYKGADLKNRSKYARTVAQRCPHDLGPADQVPGVVPLYRRVLASQPDDSVTFIAVGQMNNLVDLLRSPPDDISPSSGRALVRQKVVEAFVMAPYFNERNDYQRAYNFSTAPQAAREFLDLWPTAIRFGEGNLGHSHSIGARLAATPPGNPARVAFEAYSGSTAQDRHCADPTTVLYAVFRTRYFDEVGPGSCDLRPSDGFTRWDAATNRQHFYNTRKLPIEDLEKVMEDLLVRSPASRGPDR